MRCAGPSLAAFAAAVLFLGACGEKDEPEVTGPAVPTVTKETSTTTTPSQADGGPATPQSP